MVDQLLNMNGSYKFSHAPVRKLENVIDLTLILVKTQCKPMLEFSLV